MAVHDFTTFYSGNLRCKVAVIQIITFSNLHSKLLKWKTLMSV
ncbi:spore photoproduct lyase, partial [Bacillus wiedmannii]